MIEIGPELAATLQLIGFAGAVVVIFWSMLR
jgi:hypothetical protein